MVVQLVLLLLNGLYHRGKLSSSADGVNCMRLERTSILIKENRDENNTSGLSCLQHNYSTVPSKPNLAQMLSIMSWLMCVNNRSKYFISWEIYVPISSIFCTINKRTLPCCCVKRKSHLQIQSTMLCYISIRPQEHWTVWTCPSHSFDYLYL